MLTIVFVKLSVLQMYLRISNGGICTRTCVIFMAVTVAYHIGSLISHFVVCLPMDKNWYPLVDGHCADMKTAAITRTVLNAVNDLAILILPMTVLVKFQLILRQKLAVIAVFTTGALYVTSLSLGEVLP
jgi:hypothetical protein